MRLSLEFLMQALHERRVKLLMNGCSSARFLGVGMYSSSVAFREDTLYVCDGNLSGRKVEDTACRGLVWIGSNTPPDNVPVLWIQDSWNFCEVFNQIQEIFQLFHRWSALVYEAVAKRKPLADIFSLLNMVTPEPWYLADPSYRMLVIKDEPDYCEISPIWRYQSHHGHLPIDVIFRMISSGELQKMNETTEAIHFFDPIAFSNAFVSKTIFSAKGVIGHFYIIGMYKKPTAYELEIADFFGDRLTDLLQCCPEYLPTTGNFYDYYFIDLLEGTAIDDQMIAAVLNNLGWSEQDTYRVLAVEVCQKDSIEQTHSNLQIWLFEKELKGKAFLYQDQLVVLINENVLLTGAQEKDKWKLRFKRTIRQILQQFKNCGGYSEPFHSLTHFGTYYKQANVAREFAIQDGKAGALVAYADVATDYLRNILYEVLPREMICHPAVVMLQQYDRINNTDLTGTLRCYLNNEQNMQKTSQMLYIHRNSLMYRMDRIHQITKLDLSNPQERLRIALSFSGADRESCLGHPEKISQ